MKKIIFVLYFIVIAVIYGSDSDASLKELSVNNGESRIYSTLRADLTSYAAIVNKNTTIAYINVVPSSSNAAVLYNRSLELQIGVNETLINVMAANGTQTKYKLKILRPKNSLPTVEELEIENILYNNMDNYFKKELYENISQQNIAIQKLIEWLNNQSEIVYVSIPKNIENTTISLTILFKSGSLLNYYIFKDRLPSLERYDVNKYFFEQLRENDNYTVSVKNLIDWLSNRKDIKNISIIGEDKNETILLINFLSGRRTKLAVTKGEYLIDKYFIEQLNISGDLDLSINKLVIWMKENRDFTMVKESRYKNVVVISMKYKEGISVDYVIRKTDYKEKWNIDIVE